ncbi:hypothetical protein [Promicromonospora soli]
MTARESRPTWHSDGSPQDNFNPGSTIAPTTDTDLLAGARELALPLARLEAEQLVAEVRAELEAIAPKVTRLYQGRAWVAMGYGTWAELCTAEFQGGLDLAAKPRRQLVGELMSEGMSTRAVAEVVGVDAKTVRNDLAAGGEIVPTSATTGLDGKTYTRPEPANKPRRKPLTDAARTAGWDLRRAVERLERIAADDRFAANKTEIAKHWREHLESAVDACEDLLGRHAVTDPGTGAMVTRNAREWAERIERISAQIPYSEMTTEELEDAHGAALFLTRLLKRRIGDTRETREKGTAAERYGYVLLDVTSGPPTRHGAGDVVPEKAEAVAWAAEVNAAPPMTPWGPLRVVAAEVRAVAP